MQFVNYETMRVTIKNMVCPRCIESVADIFNRLDIPTSNIQLGEVILSEPLADSKKQGLTEQLRLRGFELLQDHKTKLVEQIKSIIIEQIHYNEDILKVNFSTLLSEKLNQEYTSLSRLFSAHEGVTIERFILRQKIEKVKELISYKELTLSEIAFKVGYSSVAHLSSQFKKETGMSPSEFKKLNNASRKSLDNI